MTKTARRSDPRDRFVAFAFAAADLLVEINGNGDIDYAAGAFRARLGQVPESFVGRNVRELVAPGDREALEGALMLLREQGRLVPLTMRLADPARTPCALAGLALRAPDLPNQSCLTFALLPMPLDANPSLRSAFGFTRAAEASIRAGAGTDVGLLEVTARAGTETSAGEIGAALEGLAPDGLATEIAPGKFGLLQADCAPADIGAIAAALEMALRGQGMDVGVTGKHLSLTPAGLSPSQAARALRQALATFARNGALGLDKSGFGGGLAGYVKRVEIHTAALGRAIQSRGFELAYQPITGLRDGRVHHYEALLRPKPVSGCPLEGPQEFVTLVETLGLAERLDLAVAGMACDAAAEAGVSVAFNISGLSAQSATFRAALLQLLKGSSAGRDGRMLVEMTETTEIEDVDEVRRTVAALHELGVKFCLDDFGAGAADVRILRALSADVVKLDGSYVPGIGQPGRERAFVGGMVEIARAAGAKVVAERVETKAESDALRDLGVDYGQGWHFGRAGPLPAPSRPAASTAPRVGKRRGAVDGWS